MPDSNITGYFGNFQATGVAQPTFAAHQTTTGGKFQTLFLMNARQQHHGAFWQFSSYRRRSTNLCRPSNNDGRQITNLILYGCPTAISRAGSTRWRIRGRLFSHYFYRFRGKCSVCVAYTQQRKLRANKISIIREPTDKKSRPSSTDGQQTSIYLY